MKAYVPALRKLAADRIAREQDFAYVREDIETYKRAIAEKSISLNEDDRLPREKMDNEARMEARIHEESVCGPTRITRPTTSPCRTRLNPGYPPPFPTVMPGLIPRMTPRWSMTCQTPRGRPCPPLMWRWKRASGF